MKVFKIFSSFCSSSQAIDAYKRVFGESENIKLTESDDYTHAIILNIAMPELKCPKENVIGFAFEPPMFLFLTDHFVNYVQKNVGRYYIGEKYGLPEEFIEHQSFMWHIPIPVTINPKTKLMSIIISNKNFSENHRYRFDLAVALLVNKFPVDVWGLGCEYISNGGDRVKGKFVDKEPYDGYMYTIAIENYVHPEYISEKVLNPLFYRTIPLYIGATNIDNYFPGYTIKLTGIIKNDLDIIYNVIKNKPVIVIDPIVVKDRMNVWKHLDEIFDKEN
jgi:hypothetical protein